MNAKKVRLRRLRKNTKGGGQQPRAKGVPSGGGSPVRGTKGGSDSRARPKQGGGQAQGSGKGPIGNPIRVAVMKEATKQFKDRFSIANDVATAEEGDQGENLDVVINPVLLSQFVFGFLGRTLCNSDSLSDLSNLYSVAMYYLQWFSNLSACPVQSWPEDLIILHKRCQSRRIGKYCYTANFSAVNALAADLALSGATLDNVGFRRGPPGPSYDSSGFNILGTGFTTTTDTGVREWLSQFTGELRVRPFDSVKDDPTDASAFSYDVGGARPIQSVSLGTGINVATIAGQVAPSSYLYITQAGTCALETPMKTPWLAKLRLGTGAPLFGSSTSQTSFTVIPDRFPRHYLPSMALPSCVGYSRACPAPFKAAFQLKVVPGGSLIQHVLDRLEATATKSAAVSNWLASFSATDVSMLAYTWVRLYVRRFSGVDFGPISVSGGTQVDTCEAYSVHVGFNMLSNCRIPEFICKLLNNLAPYADKSGALYPYVNSLIPSNQVPSLSPYTGTAVSGTLPTVQAAFNNPGSSNPGMWQRALALLLKYKGFESILAASTNMVLFSSPYPSLLDITIITVSGGTVIGALARRPLTDDVNINLMTNIAALSYDQGAQPAGVSATIVSSARVNQEFNQTYHREYSGFDTRVGIASTIRYDGLVNVGVETRNIPDSSGGGQDLLSGGGGGLGRPVPPPIGPPLMLEVPRQDRGALAKFASRMIPRRGKYCGPGWTAGVDTFDEDPTFLDGKYDVRPSDKEDAICKMHDEAYATADGDAEKILAADNRMLGRLQALRQKEGLSFYGHAADLAIRVKAHGAAQLARGDSPF